MREAEQEQDEVRKMLAMHTLRILYKEILTKYRELGRIKDAQIKAMKLALRLRGGVQGLTGQSRKTLNHLALEAWMSDDDEVQDTFAILDTELSELRETLEVAYATKDLALQNQVMRRVDQIGAMLADLEKRDSL